MESLADEIIAMREGRIVNVDKNCHEGGFEVKNKRLHHRAILLFAPFAGSLFAIGLRITRLNGSYLATEDCYGYPQKPIEWNGLKIELIGAEIVDGEAFLQEYNIDRESIFSDSLSEKNAMFHISVTKVSDSPLLTYYRFDYCGAERWLAKFGFPEISNR